MFSKNVPEKYISNFEGNPGGISKVTLESKS